MSDTKKILEKMKASSMSDIENMIAPKYEDTGKTKTPFELIDSVALAPIRAGASEYAKSKDWSKTVQAALDRVNKDPEKSPNYGDVAMDFGASPLVATGAELVGQALSPNMGTNFGGTVAKVAKSVNPQVAQKIAQEIMQGPVINKFAMEAQKNPMAIIKGSSPLESALAKLSMLKPGEKIGMPNMTSGGDKRTIMQIAEKYAQPASSRLKVVK